MAAIDWIPPVAKPVLRRWLGTGLRFNGRYGSWEAALRQSAGYDDPDIINRVVQATRLVVEGKAKAERDGTLLDSAPPPWFVISALAGIVDPSRPVHVVDFGGALGTMYRAVAPFAPPIGSWTVIEQPDLVAAGEEFATSSLNFANSFDLVPHPIDMVLFSSVLQYLPDAEAICSQAIASGARRIVIDRSPFSTIRTDEVTVQQVGRARRESYPCRIFGSDFLSRAFPGWTIVGEQQNAEGWHKGPNGLFCFRGYILDRKEWL